MHPELCSRWESLPFRPLGGSSCATLRRCGSVGGAWTRRGVKKSRRGKKRRVVKVRGSRMDFWCPGTIGCWKGRGGTFSGAIADVPACASQLLVQEGGGFSKASPRCWPWADSAMPLGVLQVSWMPTTGRRLGGPGSRAAKAWGTSSSTLACPKKTPSSSASAAWGTFVDEDRLLCGPRRQ